MRTGLVPEPQQTYKQFAGDPVTIYLNKRAYHKRLFVGGIETQSRQRPQVDSVLNLGEEASIWAKNSPPHPADRWVNKGEGKEGMTVAEPLGGHKLRRADAVGRPERRRSPGACARASPLAAPRP